MIISFVKKLLLKSQNYHVIILIHYKANSILQGRNTLRFKSSPRLLYQPKQRQISRTHARTQAHSIPIVVIGPLIALKPFLDTLSQCRKTSKNHYLSILYDKNPLNLFRVFFSLKIYKTNYYHCHYLIISIFRFITSKIMLSKRFFSKSIYIG